MHLLYEIEYKHVNQAERRRKVSVPWGITWNKSIHSKFKEIQFVTSEQIPLKKRLFKFMDTLQMPWEEDNKVCEHTQKSQTLQK